MRPPRNYFARTSQRDAGMLSRVADSSYWMSRYLERAAQTARLVDVEFQLWLDQTPEAAAEREGHRIARRRRACGDESDDRTEREDDGRSGH